MVPFIFLHIKFSLKSTSSHMDPGISFTFLSSWYGMYSTKITKMSF